MIPSLRELASAIKQQGAKAVLQIFHAGRMSPPELVPEGRVVSASAVAAEHAKQPFLVGYRFSPEEPSTPGITLEDTLALTEVLAEKELDYLHVSLHDFWSPPRSERVEAGKTRIELIQKQVGNRVPLIGVGSIHTADEALEALQTGVPFIALGRELIIEPEWVEKVANGKEEEIQTVLRRSDQARLDVPDPLWQAIMNTPGWFPVAD